MLQYPLDRWLPQLASLPWSPNYRDRNTKTMTCKQSSISKQLKLFVPIHDIPMPPIEAIADPTDPGTLRPNLPPEPVIGDHYDLREYPQFHHKVNLPIGVNNTDAFSIWSLFFNEEQLQNIVSNTNTRAQLRANADRCENPPNGRPSARYHHWFDTSSQELYIFLAILIYMGLHPEFDIENYWSCEDLMPDHSKVTSYMSCNRWQDIWANFHISPLITKKRETEFVKVSYVTIEASNIQIS
jgi:hypothetical protein